MDRKRFDENNGVIFNIQKFSIHDGPGIRTLIFMKGCPLRCLWCSNPESQNFNQDILFVQTKCIGCNRCVEVCPQDAINKEDYTIDRSKCNTCGLCADVCFANAKKLVGRWVTRREIIDEIEKDRIIYRNSGGGVTVGGGEPLGQPDFVRELLRECRLLDINTAIETCGYADWEKVKGIFLHTDHVFLDLKHMDSEKHRKFTGVGNTIILENARRIAEMGNEVTFRIPLIPGYNDDENNIKETAEFVNKLGDKVEIEILLYHRLGEDKFKWMDREYKLHGTEVPTEEVKKTYNDIFKSYGCKVVE